MKKVVVEAPAKLNLVLDVTGLAADGYHLVDMIMQTVDVYERVEIRKSRGYSLRLPGSKVPTNEKNTATKAAAAFFRETGLLAGAEIVVHKKVPTRAGMAGGSADAAAVLVGLNELYGARLTPDELCAIGAAVGADVPFSIKGGTARVRGIGEIITPLPPLPACWFVVAMPEGGVSTPAAYAAYDAVGSPLHPDLNAAEAALRAGKIADLLPHMQNALEHANGGESARRLRRAFAESGAATAMMTGSGAAVFGLFWQQDDARRAAEKLLPLAREVFVAQPTPNGARVTERM